MVDALHVPMAMNTVSPLEKLLLAEIVVKVVLFELAAVTMVVEAVPSPICTFAVPPDALQPSCVKSHSRIPPASCSVVVPAGVVVG